MAPAALLTNGVSRVSTQQIRPTSSASNVNNNHSNCAHRDRRFSHRATISDVIGPTSSSDEERSANSPSRSFEIQRLESASRPQAAIDAERIDSGCQTISLSAAAKPFSLQALPASISPSVAASVSSFSPQLQQHNSVTVKSNTSVKDAAGAIFKVLDRIPSALVTALRLEAGSESVNRAVKSLAVARKYLQDQAAGSYDQFELSFLPVHRSNSHSIVDPNLFAFLAFKIKLSPSVHQQLEENNEDSLDDISVGKRSDIFSTANAIIRAVAAKGHAVMKAGGSDAVFVAMSSLTSARQELKTRAEDLMAIAQWKTGDTCGHLGRETKYLRFDILPCPVGGPRVEWPLMGST